MRGKTIRLVDSHDSDLSAIEDWATLLTIFLAQPDADTALPQMHRVAWQIVDHVRAIRAREEAKAKRGAA